jgi:hypothetical protein
MPREPLLMIAIGKKGVGKSYQHVLLMNSYVMGDYNRGIVGRKCLVMDVNDEYSEYKIKAISLTDIVLFTAHPQVEIRRVRPFHPNGARMTLEEWSQALFYVLSVFRNGMLVIEDINKFVSDHMPSDLVGAICTNRHVGLDIIMSYQSIGRITTKLWGNSNCVRFHKNIESVERHQIKFPDKYEFLRIAELIVNKKYDEGDKRYFLYVDLDEMKIRGNYTAEDLDEAIEQFISENYSALTKPYLVMKVEGNQKKYNEQTARQEVKRKLIASYKG